MKVETITEPLQTLVQNAAESCSEAQSCMIHPLPPASHPFGPRWIPARRRWQLFFRGWAAVKRLPVATTSNWSIGRFGRIRKGTSKLLTKTRSCLAAETARWCFRSSPSSLGWPTKLRSEFRSVSSERHTLGRRAGETFPRLAGENEDPARSEFEHCELCKSRIWRA